MSLYSFLKTCIQTHALTLPFRVREREREMSEKGKCWKRQWDKVWHGHGGEHLNKSLATCGREGEVEALDTKVTLTLVVVGVLAHFEAGSTDEVNWSEMMWNEAWKWHSLATWISGMSTSRWNQLDPFDSETCESSRRFSPHSHSASHSVKCWVRLFNLNFTNNTGVMTGYTQDLMASTKSLLFATLATLYSPSDTNTSHWARHGKEQRETRLMVTSLFYSCPLKVHLTACLWSTEESITTGNTKIYSMSHR